MRVTNGGGLVYYYLIKISPNICAATLVRLLFTLVILVIASTSDKDIYSILFVKMMRKL